MAEAKETKKPASIRLKMAVDRYKFEGELGLKVIKAKHKTIEKLMAETDLSEAAAEVVKEAWDKVGDITVAEALGITNLEARRICFKYIGIENVFKELQPQLVDKQTIKKSTKVNAQGDLETFDDTYELYKVSGERLIQGGETSSGFTRTTPRDFYILRCKCTTTDREYLIYVQDIWTAAGRGMGRLSDTGAKGRKEDAIEAVAWTIQVDVDTKFIEKIVRQGDCIMVKVADGYKKTSMRHLTKQEYLEKVVMES